MRFRILKNEEGEYKVQRKGFVFWYDVGRWIELGQANHPGEKVLKTLEEAEELIARCQCESRQENWHVVGSGKILPPRPWPAPPAIAK